MAELVVQPVRSCLCVSVYITVARIDLILQGTPDISYADLFIPAAFRTRRFLRGLGLGTSGWVRVMIIFIHQNGKNT